MECARCKTTLEADSAFCRICGTPVAPAGTTPRSPRQLYRRSAEGRLAGVCAGLADYLQVDVTLIRLAWILFSIVPGCFLGGILAYLIAAIILPNSTVAPTALAPTRRLTRSVTDRKIGGVCGGLGEYLDLDSTAVRLLWVALTIFPGAIVCGVLVYVVAWFVIPEGHREVLTAAPSAA